jgi:hypothetical protein
MDEKYAIIILDRIIHLDWRNIVGIIFVVTAILDAFKYHWQAQKIMRNQVQMK